MFYFGTIFITSLLCSLNRVVDVFDVKFHKNDKDNNKRNINKYIICIIFLEEFVNQFKFIACQGLCCVPNYCIFEHKNTTRKKDRKIKTERERRMERQINAHLINNNHFILTFPEFIALKTAVERKKERRSNVLTAISPFHLIRKHILYYIFLCVIFALWIPLLFPWAHKSSQHSANIIL